MKRNLFKRSNKRVEVVKKKNPKWLEIITTYEPFFSLIVAVLAIGISIYALNDSNKTSLENTKQLEKISKLIDKQTEITNKQIEVLQKQSELSKRQIKDHVLSGVAFLRIDRYSFDSKKFSFEIRNLGIRTAHILDSRIFAVYKTDKTFIIEKIEEIELPFCYPNTYEFLEGSFKHTIENINKLYIVIEITYYDEYSGEEFCFINYFNNNKSVYGKARNLSKENEKKIVFENINNFIDKNNKILKTQEKHIELESRLPNAKEMLNR